MRETNLSDIKPGTSAVVCAFDADSSLRRRLLGLGLCVGTGVTCLFDGPFRDPKAFLIRGAVVALRQEDCVGVLVN